MQLEESGFVAGGVGTIKDTKKRRGDEEEHVLDTFNQTDSEFNNT